MGEGNAAVQAVGRTFFRITLIGYTLSGLTMFPSVIFGIKANYFTWKMDRCTCVLASSSLSTPTSSALTSTADSCVVGADIAEVNIGWKKFTMDTLKHTVGCQEAVNRYTADPEQSASDFNLDEPRSMEAFDDVYSIKGEFQKTDYPTQADEDNGGGKAGGGVVAMQVVLSMFSIFTFKMLNASYLSNGSHCSVGLGLMTRINLLMGVGTAASLVSFWWLIEGRFGDESKALTTALENVIFDECWAETVDQYDCPVRPWDFEGPGYALWLAIFQVGLFMLMTLLMLWKAPTVEGVLDGSMDPTGIVLKPRVVEVEMVVGKALATDGDPDYDSENPLYNGAATMIRPYPLPKSAKAAKAAEIAEGEEAVAMGVPPGGGSSTASSDYEAKDDPELQDDTLSALHSEYAGPADLEMIVEESEEDRASSRYSETRYSEASRYSDTYSDYGDRPSRQQQQETGKTARHHPAPIR